MRSPVTLLCVAAAPCFSTIACAGSARDYLNAPIDSWLTTYNVIYSASVTPEDGTDISSRARSNVFGQSVVISRTMDFWGRSMKELRMIALLHQVTDPGHGEGARWAEMRKHRIMSESLADFGASSKFNAEWEFVSLLKEKGRKSADTFLTAHGEDIGKHSTADLDVLLAEC